MLVKVGTTLGILGAIDGNRFAGAPAQMKQTLDVIGMVVRQQDRRRALTLTAIRQIQATGIEQVALPIHPHLGATGPTPVAAQHPGLFAGHASAAKARHLGAVTGADETQFHDTHSSASQASSDATVAANVPLLSSRCTSGQAAARR